MHTRVGFRSYDVNAVEFGHSGHCQLQFDHLRRYGPSLGRGQLSVSIHGRAQVGARPLLLGRRRLPLRLIRHLSVERYHNDRPLRRSSRMDRCLHWLQCLPNAIGSVSKHSYLKTFYYTNGLTVDDLSLVDAFNAVTEDVIRDKWGLWAEIVRWVIGVGMSVSAIAAIIIIVYYCRYKHL